MLRRHALGALAVLAAILAVSIALAGQTPPPASDTPAYNTAAEFTVTGTVTEVKTHTSTQGYADMHLVITTPKGPMEVHLGPASYVTKRGFQLAQGDEIAVTGSKVAWEGSDVLVAREVVRKGRTLTVRHADGHPAWPSKLKA